MSRHRFDGVQWCLVAGVDRVTSSFIEVWRQPYEDQETMVLMVNNRGVAVYDDNLPPQVVRAINTLANCFNRSRQQGNHYPNLGAEHANLIALAFGFQNMTGKLMEVFD